MGICSWTRFRRKQRSTCTLCAAMAYKSAAKTTKVMKSKSMSKIAKGRYAKSVVLRGGKEKTVGGLTKELLMKNKRGKVVSKRAAAQGKKAYRNIQDWVSSVVAARKALQVTGFVAVNGKSLQGKALYVKSKALRASRRGGEVTTTAAVSAETTVQ